MLALLGWARDVDAEADGGSAIEAVGSVKVYAGFFSVAVVIVAVVAGALVFPRTVVKTRVVHVVDPRPRVSNQASPSEVLANFDRRPRSHPTAPLPGYDCSLWASPWKQVAAGDPVMLVEVCVRELQQ